MLNGLARLLFVYENPSNPAEQQLQTPPHHRNGSDRFTEPAPPSYEEALSLFEREAGVGGGRGVRSTRGGSSRRSSADYEMAVRMQRAL